MGFSEQKTEQEAQRLYEKTKNLGWSFDECLVYAPLTLEINRLKKEENAIILAHSYQSPDIVYGIADFVGDSYGLSKIAAEHPADKIVFCSVLFMAETAKILSPDKVVLVPSPAGCSLADSITAEDVRELKKQHPNIPVACYVNTTAAVKAECDTCVTSSNVVKVVNSLPGKEVIFLPDKYMASYIRRHSDKKIIDWPGVCVVHEEFTTETIKEVRDLHPGAEILVHPECTSSVIDEADFVGSTSQMIDYVKDSTNDHFMIVSECGLSDRIKAEQPFKKIVGTCSLCPYMKSIQIKDVLTALKDPQVEQIVEIPDDIVIKAKTSLDKMFELS